MKLYIYNLFYELLQLISLKSFLYFRGALAPKGIPFKPRLRNLIAPRLIRRQLHDASGQERK